MRCAPIVCETNNMVGRYGVASANDNRQAWRGLRNAGIGELLIQLSPVFRSRINLVIYLKTLVLFIMLAGALRCVSNYFYRQY